LRSSADRSRPWIDQCSPAAVLELDGRRHIGGERSSRLDARAGQVKGRRTFILIVAAIT
jgi:hypothetical protein